MTRRSVDDDGATPLLLLHGFLGGPGDWDEFLDAWPSSDRAALRDRAKRADLFALQSSHGPASSSICRALETRHAATDGVVVVGYSMGGRIALRLIARGQLSCAGAVLIGANPGLRFDDERTARAAWESHWRERLERDPWTQFRAEWNRLPVFGGRDGPERPEPNRRTVAEAMQTWSLARQPDFRRDRRVLATPILWLAGEDDAKYCELGREMAQRSTHAASSFAAIPGAAHRVLHEAPRALAARVEPFVRALTCAQ